MSVRRSTILSVGHRTRNCPTLSMSILVLQQRRTGNLVSYSTRCHITRTQLNDVVFLMPSDLALIAASHAGRTRARKELAWTRHARPPTLATTLGLVSLAKGR